MAGAAAVILAAFAFLPKTFWKNLLRGTGDGLGLRTGFSLWSLLFCSLCHSIVESARPLDADTVMGDTAPFYSEHQRGSDSDVLRDS